MLLVVWISSFNFLRYPRKMVNYESAMAACPNHCKYFLSETLKDKSLLKRTNFELSEIFNVSKRTIQRWIETLKSGGFFVVKKAKNNLRRFTYGKSLGTTRVSPPKKATPYNKYMYIHTYTCDDAGASVAGDFLNKPLAKKMYELGINKRQTSKILKKTQFSEETVSEILDFYLSNKKQNTQWWQERRIKNPPAYFRSVIEQSLDIRPKPQQNEDSKMEQQQQARKSLAEQQLEKKAERRQMEVDDQKRKRLAHNVESWVKTLTDDERKSIEGTVEPLKKPNLITHYIKNIA